MKRYFIKQGEFANMYALAYTTTAEEDAAAQAEGYERITRAEAIAKAKAERERAEYDSASSGYADDHVWPYGRCHDMAFVEAHAYDKEYIVADMTREQAAARVLDMIGEAVRTANYELVRKAWALAYEHGVECAEGDDSCMVEDDVIYYHGVFD